MDYPNLSPTVESWTSFFTAEMLTFSLLGKLLIELPEAGWLYSLADEDVFSEIPLGMEMPEAKKGCKLLQDWMRGYLQDSSGETYSVLSDDYNHLFIGPGKVVAPPWESVYRTKDRLVFQEQTIKVRNWYRRFGLEAEKLYQEPDDHIGLELIFIAYLANLGIQALENQDETEFSRLLQAQTDFIEEHPIQWAHLWCTDMLEFSRTDFYKGIALVVKGVLKYAHITLKKQFEE